MTWPPRPEAIAQENIALFEKDQNSVIYLMSLLFDFHSWLPFFLVSANAQFCSKLRLNQFHFIESINQNNLTYFLYLIINVSLLRFNQKKKFLFLATNYAIRSAEYTNFEKWSTVSYSVLLLCTFWNMNELHNLFHK